MARALFVEGLARNVHLDRTEGLFATAMTVTLTPTPGRSPLNCTPCSGVANCFCDVAVAHAWTRDQATSPWTRVPDYRSECGTGRWPFPAFIHGNGPSEVMLPELQQRAARNRGSVRTLRGHHTPQQSPVFRRARAVAQRHAQAGVDRQPAGGAMPATVPLEVRFIARSCRQHAALWPAFQQMWAPQLAFVYIGDPAQTLTWTLREGILSIRTGDDYDNLPVKFILALVYFRRHFAGGVLHIDDDARRVGSFKPSPPLTKVDYGGPRLQGAHRKGANRTGHWDKVGPDSYWYRRRSPPHNSLGHTCAHGGCGFYLSAKAIMLVLSQWNEENTEQLFHAEIFDDVMVSDVLAKHRIFARHIANSGILGDKPEQKDTCRYPCRRNF